MDLNELDPTPLTERDLLELAASCFREHGRPPRVGVQCSAVLNTVAKRPAILDVLVERVRQVEVEGWTPEHDDTHDQGELAAMAAFYAMPEGCRDWDTTSTGYGDTLGEAILPDGWKSKTGDRRRELVKAGALIIAEIERLDREFSPFADAPFKG